MKLARLLGLGLATTGLVLAMIDTLSLPPSAGPAWGTYRGPELPGGVSLSFDYPSGLFPKSSGGDGTLVWRERRSADYRLFRLVTGPLVPAESAEFVALYVTSYRAKYPAGRSSGKYTRQCNFERFHGWNTRVNDPNLNRCYELQHRWLKSEGRLARSHQVRISQSLSFHKMTAL